jgi:iron only hydrogenase large subunit-like protein/nitrogen-specific signal transduction histidine kinase
MSIVYTERSKCTGCYACIRNCPVKATRIREGLAEVIAARCIDCGDCLQMCLAKAKRVESDVERVWQLLAEPKPVIVLLSASFPAAFPEIQPEQLVTSLKKLGFSEVMEDSFGSELVCQEYARLINESNGKPVLSSTCPVVVSYIEKYYPQLIDNIAPIVSPMIAMGRVIRWQYNPKASTVFAGPCIAKKAEARDTNVSGVIDAVLTFAELKEMFEARGITPETEERGQWSGPKPNLGRLFAISGGLLKAAGLSDDIMANEIINACGKQYMPRVLREFAEGNITARLISFLYCEGCIDGPVIDNDLSVFKRREIVSRYAVSQSDPAQTKRDIQEYSDIDLSRRFMVRAVSLPAPDETEIQKVLADIGRVHPSYRMNCGACGYSSCRELAISVCQGLAEIEMCWPYLLDELKTTQEDLIQAEKLTSLGQMAASIAHEVNNPLAGVLVYIQLLNKKISGDNISKETTLNYLCKMDSEVSRSTKLIRNLLDFARQSPPALRMVDINEVVSHALELAAHSAELQNILVVKELNPSLPKVMADFDQLQQVCTNLILNAIQAMPDGGRLTLHTSTDDSQVRIELQDTGCGISPDDMRKLFTPFFTTKGKGKGVGLGLAVAYGIIQRHQGRIEVQSKEGEGTSFTIYLPFRHEDSG